MFLFSSDIKKTKLKKQRSANETENAIKNGNAVAETVNFDKLAENEIPNNHSEIPDEIESSRVDLFINSMQCHTNAPVDMKSDPIVTKRNENIVESLYNASSVETNKTCSENLANKNGEETELLASKAEKINTKSIDKDVTSYKKIEFDQDNLDSLIATLHAKLENNKLIGFDLLSIASNDKVKSELHDYTMNMIKFNYERRGKFYGDTGKIMISLILIAMDNYDGNYWEHVENTYTEVYEKRSKQKINAILRSIVAGYDDNEKRHINFVIRQTIAPVYYLDGFIGFCFEIYRENFKYELVENMSEYLKDIYVEYNNENGVSSLSSKTYKLISTTKEIIENTDWLSELIAYSSLIIKYLDHIYWNNDYDGLEYQEYLKPIFERWVQEDKNLYFKTREYKTRTISNWSPRYSLINGTIYLNIPNHLIKNSYDPRKIEVVIFNGSTLMKSLSVPEIKKVLGGYLMSPITEAINIPLGEVGYQIIYGDEIIYSSLNKLHRNYLIFNEIGREIFNNTDYCGEIVICAKEFDGITGIDIMASNSNYMLGSISIKKYDSIQIAGENIFFSKFQDGHLQAENYPETKIVFNKRSFDLFKSVDFVTVLSSCAASELVVENLNQHYHLSDLNYQQIPVDNMNFYVIQLENVLQDGFNYLRFYNRTDSKLVFKKEIFLDSNHSSQVLYENKKFTLSINSIFLKENRYLANEHGEELFAINFSNPYFDNDLQLIPANNYPAYRLDNSDWTGFNTNLSIKNIKPYSKLTITGIEFDTVLLTNPENHETTRLQWENMNNKNLVQLSKLNQVDSSDLSYAVISFFKGEVLVDSVRVYYRAVIDNKTFKISYDQNTRQAVIDFDYIGKDTITIKVLDNGSLICDHLVDAKPVNFLIGGIECFKEYQILIEGGMEDIFSLSSSKYLMYQDRISFYTSESILTREFKILKGWGERFNAKKEIWDEQWENFKNTKLSVEHKIGEDLFAGRITYLSENEDIITKKVEIELTSEISKGKFWCAIKEDDDFLLFDSSQRTVVFKEDKTTRNCMPINEFKAKY